ncbi:GreA/GreB family transcription elongation factor [Gemmobacter caeni]|uniref:GreA/GreB family transcription elongation factor n=1 Tax=Gemmobacter caeni TaxID=589035 RepID=A0A2T6B896_9RHOB|nr:GreA/GreB family elongation factor [Gemmobacter caeni]PTX52300.1 GreA/GreB family transcription elongation factor [Gemmobacter caeni]TWJ02673.1 GreA/GreB family transcription elongation factor [Gemmobacter caeni]
MFHTPAKPTPPLYDPAIGPNGGVPRLRSDRVDPITVSPLFISIGGDRSSVQGWRSALRFALTCAKRAGADNLLLSDLTGLPIRPGRGYPNMGYHPDLDASVACAGTDRTARALFGLLDGIGRSALLRVRTESGEALIEHSARTRADHRRLREARTPLTPDRRLQEAREGRALYGSLVEISVEGMFERRAFRLSGAGSDPRSGALSVRSPVGAALLGCRPGEETSYRTGPVLRRVMLHQVDNDLLIDRLMTRSAPLRNEDPLSEPNM